MASVLSILEKETIIKAQTLTDIYCAILAAEFMIMGQIHGL